MKGDVEYAVRYREKDAIGQLSNSHTYAEWSCGHLSVYRTFAEAEEVARDWRHFDYDYMANIEVVRRVVPDWEVVEA